MAANMGQGNSRSEVGESLAQQQVSVQPHSIDGWLPHNHLHHCPKFWCMYLKPADINYLAPDTFDNIYFSAPVMLFYRSRRDNIHPRQIRQLDLRALLRGRHLPSRYILYVYSVGQNLF